jgi:hypothetical protein
VRKAQYFRNKNFLLENRFGTALQQVPYRIGVGAQHMYGTALVYTSSYE